MTALPVSIVVMGVSGCGKTTVGKELAESLGYPFVDADDHHPASNVEKMRAGVPLTDTDREPWLDRLNALLQEAEEKRQPVVLACSALRQRYRDHLARGLSDLRFVFLSGTQELIAQRLAARQHRYMPVALLRSQFDTLEPPTGAVVVDIDAPVQALVARVLRSLAPILRHEPPPRNV